jgi:hypothetical protein
VLHQPRPALTSQITLEPGIATGISNVTQTLGLRSAAPGDRLKVYASSQYEALAAIRTGIDPLLGDYEEPTFDELLIATVYLLSPPNKPLRSAPDATWIPYVRHGLFWNLNYATPPFRIAGVGNAVGDLLAPVKFLGGGAAAIVISFLTASINDAYNQALNILTAHSMAGSFWTATGGGSSSEFPEVVAGDDDAGSTGLDKDGRLQAKRNAAAKALKSARLDPAFPYRAMPFPEAFLE